jgi:hypothetical protein
MDAVGGAMDLRIVATTRMKTHRLVAVVLAELSSWPLRLEVHAMQSGVKMDGVSILVAVKHFLVRFVFRDSLRSIYDGSPIQ